MTVVTTVSRAQPALALEVPGEDGDDEVAVDQGAASVDGQHAVAVAVEGQAQVEAVGPHDLLQRLEVGGAALGVDVAAVGRGRSSTTSAPIRPGPAARPRTWRRWRSRRRCAGREVERDALDDVPDVAFNGSLERSAQPKLSPASELQIVVLDVRLDLGLFLVAELEAEAVKNLMPLSAKGLCEA